MKFSELPLHPKVIKGLARASYVEMTDVQRVAIPEILAGRDSLVTAKTGSGKTLAFLIPILELLTKLSISRADGPSALIISPTRELALQSFEVLKKIGIHCSTFSAGLVIGGKSFKEEKDVISQMNILIATPGRLLQHMDQTEGFELNSIRILILDEADKILELGFASTINAIVAGLPPPASRQTLLFSATMTSKLEELARLSLQNPLAIQVTSAKEQEGRQKDGALPEMPDQLQQFYMRVDFDLKIDTLYSFVRTHLKSKILVFVSSCKEARFLFELFCKLHPGIPVTSLHGKLSQLRRIAIFKDFCAKNASMMIATDIAARGLDFPLVDWVIHFDAPDSIETYIHRCGRTARYEAVGNSLMFITPFELDSFPFLSQLPNCSELSACASKLISIQERISAICTQYNTIKYLSTCGLLTYLRSLILLLKSVHRRDFFQWVSVFINQVNILKWAHAWGHVDIPIPIKQFVSTLKARCIPSPNPNSSKNCNTNDNNHNLNPDYLNIDDSIQGHTDSEDELLVAKKVSSELDLDSPLPDMHTPTGVKLTKKKKKAKINSLGYQSDRNTRLVFDEEGNPLTPSCFLPEGSISTSNAKIGAFVSERARQLLLVDERDRMIQREKKRAKKLKRKGKLHHSTTDFVAAKEAIPMARNNGENSMSYNNNTRNPSSQIPLEAIALRLLSKVQ